MKIIIYKKVANVDDPEGDQPIIEEPLELFDETGNPELFFKDVQLEPSEHGYRIFITK